MTSLSSVGADPQAALPAVQRSLAQRSPVEALAEEAPAQPEATTAAMRHAASTAGAVSAATPYTPLRWLQIALSRREAAVDAPHSLSEANFAQLARTELARTPA